METQGNKANPAVQELVEVTQAIAEGDFDRKVEHDFQGELGRLAVYIETLRQNLKSLSPSVASSVHLMPRAGRGVAKISQQAEMSVNSILELVEEMCADQETISHMLERVAQGEPEALNLTLLRAMADKSRTSLMSLMSYLSFQDVVRQQAEKIQAMIDVVEEKIRELLEKFKLQAPEPAGDEGTWEIPGRKAGDPSLDVIDQTLIDELFK